MKPCPVCDVDHIDEPIVALAMGAALGQTFIDMSGITNQVCGPHRRDWMRAMLRATQKMQALAATESAPPISNGTEGQ